MKKFVFVVSLFVAIFCVVEASQNYVETAGTFINMLSEGKYAKAESMLSNKMSQALPADKLEALWNGFEERCGEFQSFSVKNYGKSDGYAIVVVEVSFKKESFYFKVVLDSNLKVAGLWIKQVPSYHLPSYADFSKFVVKKLEIGNEWKLPAELTVPKGKGPFPAVVLVAGSGPEDMNETVGRQHPFEDLAYGLSSLGIVVLRYDKRSYVYGRQMLANDSITVKNVYLQDVSYAVKTVEKFPFV